MNQFEEEYMDVLPNIEFGLITVYREDEEMTDWQALEAINSLIRTYTAEIRRRSAPALKLNELSQSAYDRMMGMCDLHLGREALIAPDGRELTFPRVSTTGEIVHCLKRIRRSIEMWNKEMGRRGYFDVVGQYVQ